MIALSQSYVNSLFFCPHLDLNHLDSLQNMTLVHYMFDIILIEPDKEEVASALGALVGYLYTEHKRKTQ